MRASRRHSGPVQLRRRGRLRATRWPLAAVLLTGLLSAFPAPAADAGAPYDRPNDASVVTTWNQIGVTTLIGDATKPGPQPFLYLGFLQAAVYDAVVGVHPAYEHFSPQPRPPRPASAAAAALGAAYGVLSGYVPAAQATLTAAYETSLARIRPGVARDNGVAYGAAVAQRLIDSRAHDGRNAATAALPTPAPGVWRPTPPGFGSMAAPWMGAVTPLALRSGAQFDPGPPPALTSAAYASEVNEVQAFGAATGSSRSPEQTATALFFSGNAIVQYNAATRDQVATRDLGITDAARLLAAVDVSQADTLIAIWNAKRAYLQWRPLSAITLAGTDGNPATTADPSWSPFLVNPPYPDWVSGYSGQTGAFTGALRRVVGDDLAAHLISSAVPGSTRTFSSASALEDEVVDARVWLGIHFRSSDTAGVHLGHQVADWVMDHHFQPADG